MATSRNSIIQNRKRRYTEAELLKDNESQPSKRYKRPPAFWDNLSTIPLTRSALKELDRRQALYDRSRAKPKVQKPRTRSAVPESKRKTRSVISVCDFLQEAPYTHIVLLKAFAKRGGPDLSNMRRNRDPEESTSSSRPSSSRRRSTNTTTTTTKSKKSNAYDRAFEQNLIDHGVYLDNRARKPENIAEIKDRLANPRPSLSPSNFSESAFEAFQTCDLRAKDEDDVMVTVIPVISGKDGENHFSARNTAFGNLRPLTDGNIVSANPDLYYGARPEQLNRHTRQELNSYIIPSTQQDKPMAPNFFLEVKGPDGAPSVAKRQAVYNGAVGARGMHKLQSSVSGKPVYDNSAYTITQTYQNGQLLVYTTHLTEPGKPGNSPESHLTQVRGYTLTDSAETCRLGITAFRNGKDLAQEWRNSFIAAANEKAECSNTDPSTPRQSGQSDIEEQNYEDGSQTSIDAEYYARNHKLAEAHEETSADELALDVPTKFSQKRRKPDVATRKGGEPVQKRLSRHKKSF